MRDVEELFISGCFIQRLNILKNVKGDVKHFAKISNPLTAKYGEVYFSSVNFGQIKGWKKHKMMTLNIAVPVGKIKFVLYDDRPTSSTKGRVEEIVLSTENYILLSICPDIWVSFSGESKNQVNLLANFADIEHRPGEAIIEEINSSKIPYKWSS